LKISFLNKSTSIIICAVIIFSALSRPVYSSHSSETSERKIIVFKSTLTDDATKENIIKKHGGIKIKKLDLVNGAVVYLTNKQKNALSIEGEIARIEDDVIISVSGKGSDVPTNTQPAQQVPWGILQIKADSVWLVTTADRVKVAVIDSGIDLSHPDLIDNIKGGYNTINPKKSANDDYGHGTHVAGIIAAENNSIGVVGVGPQIDLYAVKVLNSQGSGYVSDVIEGLDWSMKNGMQIINMSFGMPTDSQSLHDAISLVNQSGIVQIASAGNSYGGSVSYPAAYPEVISVSATDSSNQIAPFSSKGKVDLSAPGVSIFSTYKGSTYQTMNGTSMAAPHVTGVAALLLSVPSKCDLNYDGLVSPAEIKQRLENTAVDLGVSGKDGIFGAGLVNAYSAIQ